MGKVINNIQRMGRLMKPPLVLLLTLGTTIFMYQGWFKPASASAATVVYGVTVPSTASTGIDGAAQMPTGGASIATAPTVRGNMSTTVTTSGASYRPTTGMTSGTPTTLLKLYSPAYATAQTITAPAGSYAIRGYNASDRWTFHIYSHNPAGTAGNKTLMYSSSTITSGTGSTVTVTPTYTLVNSSMAAGNKLLVEVVYTPGGTTYTPRVYLDGTAASTWSRLTVTETAAVTDTTPPVAGTVTITPDTGSTYTSAAPTITTIFTDTQSAVTSCQYTTNGTTWVTGAVTGTTPTYTCTASPTGLSGFLNINMRATSTGGTTTATQIQRTVDTTVPTDGALTVTKGNALNSLSWTAATDTGGSGIASYILRFATGATAPANCTSGTAVTGSPFPSTTLSTTHAGLINGTQYSYRLCATDNLGNTSGGVTGSATPAVGPVSTITSCSGCHGNPPIDGTARNVPAGQFQGSHNLHGATCTVCHVDNGTNLKHADGSINMAANINNTGGAYSKGATFAVSNAAFSGGSCSGTYCHGQGAPTWGATSTAPVNGYPYSANQCAKCHSGNLATDVTASNPFYSTAIPKNTANTDAKVGAHTSHMTAPDGLAAAFACAGCHATVALNTATHMNGATTFSWSTLAQTGGLTPTYNGATGTCTNVYCHGAAMPGGDTTGTNRAPVWNSTTYLPATIGAGGTACKTCHGFPPLPTSGHPTLTTAVPATFGNGTVAIGTSCSCHSNINSAGTTYANIFVDKTLHINGVLETPAGGTCIGCHASIQTGTHGTPRDAVVTEFGLAWGHKKAGRGAVTDADCIVCHLEGDFATQKPSAKHQDGNIDLRDPDGVGEVAIKNISGGVFTFTKFATSYAAGSRTATGHLSDTDIANVITQKFCLACHDSNGATNTTARSNNGGTGTAAMPFGGLALGATYTAANNAIGTQGLVDVKSQFALTNSSRHPVLGPRTRDFPYSTRLAPPYNNIGTARDANGSTGHVTAASVVINCFDCHNTPTTPLTTRTVAAHGNAVTLRGTIYAVGAVSTLCSTCHTGYTVSATHSTGSAWSATGSDHNVSRNCQDCHGSYKTAAPVRPVRAQDYHGNNALVGGGLWPTVNSRPYAFIRAWSGTAYHRPYRATEFTTGSATCGAGTCPSGGSGGQVGDGSTRTYTAGGTY